MITGSNVLISLLLNSVEDYLKGKSFTEFIQKDQPSIKCYLIQDEDTCFFIYDEKYKIKVFFEKENFEKYSEDFPTNYFDNIQNSMILITRYKIDFTVSNLKAGIKNYDFCILIYDFIIDKSQQRNKKIKLKIKDINLLNQIILLKTSLFKRIIREILNSHANLSINYGYGAFRLDISTSKFFLFNQFDNFIVGKSKFNILEFSESDEKVIDEYFNFFNEDVIEKKNNCEIMLNEFMNFDDKGKVEKLNDNKEEMFLRLKKYLNLDLNEEKESLAPN